MHPTSSAPLMLHGTVSRRPLRCERRQPGKSGEPLQVGGFAVRLRSLFYASSGEMALGCLLLGIPWGEVG